MSCQLVSCQLMSCQSVSCHLGDCQSVSCDLEQRHGALSLIPPRTKKAKMYFLCNFFFCGMIIGVEVLQS